MVITLASYWSDQRKDFQSCVKTPALLVQGGLVMKRIHFANLGKNKLVIAVAVFSAACLLFGLFDGFDLVSTSSVRYVLGLGYFLSAIFLTHMFWYKNYVQWNKRGMMIRIDSFFGKNLKFEEIISAKLDGDILEIMESKNSKVSIDLSEIVQEDRETLNQIIVEHIAVS